MTNRKKFLKHLAATAAASFAAPWATLDSDHKKHALTSLSEIDGTPEEIARSEDYWRYVQQAYTVDRSTIYLNSAGVNPASRMVQESVKRYSDEINQVPSQMLGLGTEGILKPQIETVRQKLANVFGVHKEEIAIVRNATEGLVNCELGFELTAGDEVLASHQIYGSMANALERRVRVEGIKLTRLSLPVPAENEDEIVQLYEEKITPRTKLIMLDHMSNKGQLFPVKKIVNMARTYDVSVIVDGAQTFGHLDFKQQDLGCDYFATSLHKWLSAPLGTGMLYIKKDKINSIRSLFPGYRPRPDNIRKFEAIGTHPIGHYLAISDAIEFYRGIGAKR
ncbi:MAG: aminotransferase class V-fold PLP-dependent enzyme, partial [Balneolaceae bacterium]|nr:aminotransferase class V-fold PLP-dependent enzyme [Balneolaceae bacterium]